VRACVRACVRIRVQMYVLIIMRMRPCLDAIPLSDINVIFRRL